MEAFLNAARTGDLEQLKRLLDAGADVLNARNELGQSAILLARYHRQQAAVDFLLARRPDLTLHEACAVGHAERVREVVGRVGSGAPEIDAHSKDGFTPLALACFFGQQEIAAYLVDQGANVNLAATNPMKVAPLHAAVASRHFWIAQMLVANGANVNQTQQNGFTPLHAAAMNGDEPCVRLLLENNADRTARSDTSQTALDMALLKGHAAVADLLDPPEAPPGE
ncbi:MAG: ankyrin repeat domain-containing protein [Bryobacteraceae bacterium]